jgi:hypothetical protein
VRLVLQVPAVERLAYVAASTALQPAVGAAEAHSFRAFVQGATTHYCIPLRTPCFPCNQSARPQAVPECRRQGLGDGHLVAAHREQGWHCMCVPSSCLLPACCDLMPHAGLWEGCREGLFVQPDTRLELTLKP